MIDDVIQGMNNPIEAVAENIENTGIERPIFEENLDSVKVEQTAPIIEENIDLMGYLAKNDLVNLAKSAWRIIPLNLTQSLLFLHLLIRKLL